MVVVHGKVWTFNGPVDVEKLKAGDLLIDRGPSAHKLLSIKKVKLKKAVAFKNNSAVVSGLIYTAQGAKQITDTTDLLVYTQNKSCKADTAYVVDVNEGYKLETVSSIFVNGYSVEG